MRFRILGVAAASAALLLATTATAEAAEANWLWEKPGGNNIGVGSYDDSGDVMRVNDQEADERSVVLDVWRVGAEGGSHYRCWDSRGADAAGVYCENAFNGSGWPANARLRGKLCKGEAGPGPGGGRLISCQPESQWKTFYR